MSESKALVPPGLDETMGIGEVMYKSGYFTDAKSHAQAVVKILAGREMGMGPMASMTGVHIVQGKPTIGANLIGAAVKGSGRYNYRVVSLDNDKAEIAFFEHGEEIGRSVFTMADAKTAGLTSNPTWQKYPKNMLFSRAMSNGARWFCPDVFSGVTPYTPEEMGATVDGDGEVIDVTPTPVPDAVVEPEPERVDVSGAINSPKQLYDAVQELGHYNSVPHMLNTIQKVEQDKTIRWPTNDPAWYNWALGILIEYANANKAQEVIQATAQKLDL